MALNEDQVQKVRLLLQSSGWNDVIKPLLALRANTAIKALILSPAERDGEFKSMDDAAIRARVREVEWMLTVFPNEVVVYDQNRRLDELQGHDNPEASPTANP